MTTEVPGDRHLSEEELSARLELALGADDGSDAADGTFVTPSDSHLAACPRCRAQLAALERARAALRAPVPAVAPSVRAAAIATVLAGAPASPAPAPSPRPAPVATIGRRRWVSGVGAAAAVAVLAAGITVAALHGSSTGRSTASGSAHSTSSSAASGRAPGVNGSPGKLSASGPGFALHSSQDATSPAHPVPDLGSINSARGLRGAVLPVPSAQSAAPQGAAAPGYSATAPSGQASSSLSQGTNPGSIFGPIAPADATAFPRCQSAAIDAAQSARPVGSPEELATARYRGTAALVYVFAGSGSGSPSGSGVVVAVARSTCHVLAKTSL